MKTVYILILILLYNFGCAQTKTISSSPLESDLTKITPHGVVFLQGGIVIVGGYKKDQSKWGSREAYIRDFYIDTEPGEVNYKEFRKCLAKKGRLPEEAELNYALSKNKINAGHRFEITQSDINWNGTTGGQYNLRLRGLDELAIIKPSDDDVKGTFQRRCLIPIDRKFDTKTYTITEEIHPQTGRGTQWSKLPITLKKNLAVSLLFKDSEWALVDLELDGPDSGGWIPLNKVKKEVPY